VGQYYFFKKYQKTIKSIENVLSPLGLTAMSGLINLGTQVYLNNNNNNNNNIVIVNCNCDCDNNNNHNNHNNNNNNNNKNMLSWVKQQCQTQDLRALGLAGMSGPTNSGTQVYLNNNNNNNNNNN